jgi:hypothetical protein
MRVTVTTFAGKRSPCETDLLLTTVANVANYQTKSLILLAGDPGRIRTCDLQLRRLKI